MIKEVPEHLDTNHVKWFVPDFKFNMIKCVPKQLDVNQCEDVCSGAT